MTQINRLFMSQVMTWVVDVVLSQRWEDDATVRMVVIRAAGEKAFCAGGDIRGTATASVPKATSSTEFSRDTQSLAMLSICTISKGKNWKQLKAKSVSNHIYIC